MKAFPLYFSEPEGVPRSFHDTDVPYNTYWFRFGRGRNTFDQAMENSKILFEADREADVSRINQVSVANASADSRLPYFRGKGQVEKILKGMGIPCAIT